jgi:BirA family biotin operon repressor/biotin-[acetyl-CoA-carboxylase] ligase
METTVVYTMSQTKGRGMGKNVWLAEDNKNLLFSLIVFPELKAESHFSLSMIVSLAICEYLILKGVEAKIKWPNDIWVQNKKLAGILIENSIMGDRIKSSVIGVGLNLNQTNFPSEIPNPVSLSQLTENSYTIDNEIVTISNLINNAIASLSKNEFLSIRTNYFSKLYRYNEPSKFKSHDRVFEGTIISVNQTGHLVVKESAGNISEFYFKEIEFVL